MKGASMNAVKNDNMHFQLFPCPFCGASATMWTWNGGARVQCEKWQCVREPVHLVSVGGKTPEEAANAWNARAGETAYEAALKTLELTIEEKMEDLCGTYDRYTPKRNLPSRKIERNATRKECLELLNELLTQARAEAQGGRKGDE